MTSVAAIVLAAGASKRFGSPKQLIRLGTRTLLERAVAGALDGGLDPVFIVVTPGLAIGSQPHGIVRVDNYEADSGMASSIRAGVRALLKDGRAFDGAILLACDQPAVTATHLQELARGGDQILASAYGGRRGIPAYFPAALFRDLLTLKGDSGAREMVKTAKSIDLIGGELDIDTAADLAQAQELYRD